MQTVAIRQSAGMLVSLAIAFVAPVAAAQTVVRVQSGGVPVAGAEISAFDALGRLAIARSDALGSSRLALPRAIGQHPFLLVRKLGFAPVRIAFASTDTVTITMTIMPTALARLAVEGAPLRCPANTDSAADSLWRAAAAHYTIGATHLFIGWVGARVEETVSAEQRGYGDGTELRATSHGGAYPDTSARAAVLLREPPPYAAYERHLNLLGDFWRWRYAPLQEFAAEHFVSERFRERHTFTVLGRSADATVVGFCARDLAQAEIQGELLIGDDTLVRSARWSYRLPHDDEDAGAESTFGMTTFEGGSYLIAMRGSSWRRAGRNLYNQERYEYTVWRLGRSLEAIRIK